MNKRFPIFVFVLISKLSYDTINVLALHKTFTPAPLLFKKTGKLMLAVLYTLDRGSNRQLVLSF